MYPDMSRSAIAHDGPIDLIGSVHVLANKVRDLVGEKSALRMMPAD
jgi:hypothetical protein